MSDPKSSFSCNVTSTDFVLRIFFFLGSDSPSAARLLCDSIFLVGFIIRLDCREVGEGDLSEDFFDANTPFFPTTSDIENLCRNLNWKIEQQVRPVWWNSLLLAKIRLDILKMYLMVIKTRTWIVVEMNLHLMQTALPHILPWSQVLCLL